MRSTAKWALPALLVLGFVLRMLFIRDAGFATDVQTFEAWTVSLLDHGFANFYGSSSFADYPPGYFYILGFVGSIWAPFRAHDAGFGLLSILVKMPAILADIGVGALIYAIARRFADVRIALLAAAVYVLNPATIYISANWGQVDSIAGGLALLAAFFLLKSDDERGTYSLFIPLAWVTLAYSLLIKPQAAVVIPIFLAFAFVDAEKRRWRIVSTLIGLACAALFTLALVEPFHPSQPIEAARWLIERNAFGSNVYPYNSVNAFNLWAIRGPFWQSDAQPIGFLPQYVWGMVLVGAAIVLVVWRYVTDRSRGGLLEACALALISFFILATRMHERYIFDGVLFSIACIPLARRYIWGSIALSVTLFANLVYSLQYLSVVSNHTPGMNAANLWGPITTLYAAIGVITFFILGYVYLGGAEPELQRSPAASTPSPSSSPSLSPGSWFSKTLNYFNPSEGLTRLRAPLDYVVMLALGLVSFVLSYVNYWYPAEKTGSCWTLTAANGGNGVTHCGVFDEIYFARAAEEYLHNMRIYENTHPPLSKLLVTLSVMLNGGLNGGDNAHGWRFLDVVFGALVVMLLFAFAKRVTGSTLFSAIAAGFLTLDGMHFVQSRIATPEGFVVVFSLGAIYAFYRFWIASQVEERQHVQVPTAAFVTAGIASIVAGGALGGIVKVLWHDLATSTFVILAVYGALGAYLLFRYVVFPAQFADGGREQTFADGSYALVSEASTTLVVPDGRTVSGNKAKLQYDDGDLSITYKNDPSVTYATPEANATYADNEIHSGDEREHGSSANLWLFVFTIALGLLISTKWYGVMGFPVSFVVLIGVWLQRVFLKKRPALWGNPRGFRLDGALVTIAFVAVTVYGIVWVPDLVRHSPDPNEIHNLNNVVSRQYDMYEYHNHLRATHPYSSQWWEWPLDYVPIAYYYQDNRPTDANGQKADSACCVEEITSMPNPFIMWFGLLTIPLLGVLAWREKNKGYALIVISYLLQWLPWMGSPRLIFAYHFYVNIPLICLANAIALQRLVQWASTFGSQGRFYARIAVIATVVLIAASFVYFYPILAAVKIPWSAWHARMWIDKWVVGPG